MEYNLKKYNVGIKKARSTEPGLQTSIEIFILFLLNLIFTKYAPSVLSSFFPVFYR